MQKLDEDLRARFVHAGDSLTRRLSQTKIFRQRFSVDLAAACVRHGLFTLLKPRRSAYVVLLYVLPVYPEPQATELLVQGW